MKRLLRITLIVIALAIIAFAIWFFLVLSQGERSDLIKGNQNIFPFGKIESGNINTPTNNQDVSETVDTQETIDITTERIPEKRLRQISDFPTNGFAGFSRREQQIISSSEVDENGVLVEQEQLIETEDQYVRYSNIEESSIFESKISPYSIQSQQLVENYIPNTERAIFSENGEHVVFQFWDELSSVIESYSGSIKKIEVTIDDCPFDLQKVVLLGDEGEHVTDIHKFLNRSPRTMVAQSGINSPGNEGNKATEATITAIKNFQSLNELDIDGSTGPATRLKMKEVCDDQQQILAEKEFEELDEQYEIIGSFLPENVVSITINPLNKDLFYLQNQDDGTIGVRENIQTGQKETLFQNPLKELYAQWLHEDFIEISTKPSYVAPTYSYSMDASSGEFHKSLTEDYGMTILPSPNNEKVLVSKIDGDRLITMLYDRTTGTSVTLSIQTFTDKCTWSKNSINIYCGVPENLRFGNRYPDSWYKGKELYNDKLYQIDALTAQETMLSDLTYDYSQDIDISNVRIDNKDQYLYFIDKGTEYLWSYRLFDI